MATFTELQLGDGTLVRFEVVSSAAEGGAAEPMGPEVELECEELPEGMGHGVPVARGGAVGMSVVQALRTTLKPLGLLLQEVHDAVTTAPTPPEEVNVTFGLQIGQDLRLGIVGGSGQAHLTVSATWQPALHAG
ncbi:CU044_2847 family protein [Streptomyces maoxianensis]|uniref:CU044_2847 family protein n=1 Tax=Streptomyces maoxianensis TaxID=1459942 RepID=A0ABV9G654_9ACTN